MDFVAQQIEESVTVDGEAVLVIRSVRRTRTVTADVAAGQLRLRVPMRLSGHQVRSHARAFRKRMAGRIPAAAAGDEQLMARAEQLAAQYFTPAVRPTSVTWSDRQLRRWGSTTSTTGTIRLSSRLRSMPGWVLDSVLVHELAHLVEPGHGPAFRTLIAGYPHTAEADAFLEGVSWAEQHLTGGPSTGP